MVRDILDSAAVGKLKGILQDRYGKGLKVSFMQEVSSLEITEETFLVAHGDLHIPIQVNDKYLATAIVEKGADLRDIDQETVSQLVRLFLEPEVFNWYVEQASENAKANVTRDVVSIFEPFHDSEARQSKSIESISTNILCLQSTNPHLIPRLAHNIHDITERWAYLNFSDIQNQIASAQDIKSLGALTLLINDILNLSPEMQRFLHEALAHSSPSEEPLVIIGCTSTVEDLENQKLVHPGLAKIMRMQRLEVERLPKDPQLLQETLEIMLEF